MIGLVAGLSGGDGGGMVIAVAAVSPPLGMLVAVAGGSTDAIVAVGGSGVALASAGVTGLGLVLAGVAVSSRLARRVSMPTSVACAASNATGKFAVGGWRRKSSRSL